MANAIPLSATSPASPGRHANRERHLKGASSDFEALLSQSLQNQTTLAAARPGMGQVFAPSAGAASAQANPAVQSPATSAVARTAGRVTGSADAALTEAMNREGVPASWKDELSYIMAQESGGQVGAQNPTSSARGLFQLTAANYDLNPNGAGSFGNAVEEAQGGIRYIRERYGTAENAVQFWQDHHWY